MNLVRIMFEEQETGPPRQYYRDHGKVEDLGDATLRAESIVSGEEFKAGLFEIQRDNGNVLGILEIDLLHKGCNFSRVKHA